MLPTIASQKSFTPKPYLSSNSSKLSHLDKSPHSFKESVSKVLQKNSCFELIYVTIWASLVTQMVKNLPAVLRATGDQGSVPGLGRSPGEGNGNPLEYSCLENPIDRGAWQATVHGVAMSQTRLTDFHFTC